jgi:molybdopterin converting factor small subunit
MPIVRFTSNLKRFYPELADTRVNSGTISDVINSVNETYPGIKSYLLDDQKSLRKHVNIFINSKMVADRSTLLDEIDENDEIYIMQALSGG